MINLFDRYHQKSWDLHFSLLQSGYRQPTIVLEDNGWLPEDVTSPYQWITGYQDSQGQPLYFNQLVIPDLWEIRGNSQEAFVWDYHKKRAIIHYGTPKNRRFIQQVDWLDEAGKRLISDHYNRKGYRFAQSLYDMQTGQLLAKTYYNQNQEEILVENYKTGDVIAHYKGKVSIFPSQVAFYSFYLQESDFHLDRIFYNTLGKAFLTAFELKETAEHVLFWQEPITDSLPANMQFLLEHPEIKKQIIVQDLTVFNRVQEIISPEQANYLTYLGLLYPFKPNQDFYPEALILTNTDNLEQVEELIQELPDLHFKIAAITEMSSKLMRLKQYANVSLYPNASPQVIEGLFKKSSFYLDINYGRELLSASRMAFERELVLLGFDKTVHGPTYIPSDHIFTNNQRDLMVKAIKDCLDDSYQWYSLLENQRSHANVSKISLYQEIIR